MVDVFVSQPTWVPKLFKPGLTGFLRTLSSLKLNPRTIGVTDYPVEGAFDEVIKLMSECQGAVILGYPQIWIRSGSVKDVEVDDEMTLPTEWNHIETALAMAMNKPVLIIHDIGITRGVFDRGAVNKFIYEIDLTDAGWPISEPVHGALERWRDLVNSVKSADGIPSGATPTSELGKSGEKPISDDLVKTLEVFTRVSVCTTDLIAEQLGVTVEKATYFIGELRHSGLINFDFVSEGPTRYYLTQTGRKILFDKDLL